MNKLIETILSMHSDGNGQTSWLRVAGTILLLTILVPKIVYAVKTGQANLSFNSQELELLAGFGVTKLAQNQQEKSDPAPAATA